MKKSLFTLLILIGLLSNAQTTEKIVFHSDILNQDREVWIYKPAGFDEDFEQYYEVIYVFDAQAKFYFDFIHSGIQFMNAEDYIVVGDVSPFDEATKYNRNTDFLPKPIHENPKTYFNGWNGNAQNHLEYLYKELNPYLEKNYRTLPNRTAIGHSNGATFMLYCLLQQPDLFNNFIAVSPNMAYDKEQMIERFQKFDLSSLKSDKFLYLSDANEDWNGWKQGREKLYNWLKSNPSDKIIYEIEPLSELTHFNSFPSAAMSGFYKYMDYWISDINRYKTYKINIKKTKGVDYTSNDLNMFAYGFFNRDDAERALKVIDWAIEEFPEDDNLYDSRGEFYENLKDYKNAAKSYAKAMEVLKTRQSEVEQKKFEEQMGFYKGNYDRVKDK